MPNRGLKLLSLFHFQAISITQDGKPEEKLELAFRLYDIDRNGSIEEAEMMQIIKVGYNDRLANRLAPSNLVYIEVIQGRSFTHFPDRLIKDSIGSG